MVVVFFSNYLESVQEDSTIHPIKKYQVRQVSGQNQPRKSILHLYKQKYRIILFDVINN